MIIPDYSHLRKPCTAYSDTLIRDLPLYNLAILYDVLLRLNHVHCRLFLQWAGVRASMQAGMAMAEGKASLLRSSGKQLTQPLISHHHIQTAVLNERVVTDSV